MFANMINAPLNATLIHEIQTALSSNEPNDQFSIETRVFELLLKIRNGGEAVPIEPNTMGYLYSTLSDPTRNEINFSTVYQTIFSFNNFGVDERTVMKYDDDFRSILLKMEKDPLWYDLEVTALTASETPECRVASLSYYKQRNAALLKNRDDVKQLPMFEGYNTHKDKEVPIENDFFIQGFKRVPIIKILQFRLNEELNSHYITHPCEFMLIYICMLKSMNIEYYDYGLRFIEIFMQDMIDETYPYLHLPVEYRSDGSFVGAQYHSKFPMLLRIIINRMSLLLYHSNLHSFNSEYINMYDETLLFFLTDPFRNGKRFKKAFTAVNLYYGMDVKASVPTDVSDVHLHPWYSLVDSDIQRKPPTFNQQTDCLGQCFNQSSTRLDKACYSKSVRDFLEESFIEFREMNLPLTLAFIKKRLIAARYNDGIIKDLVSIRINMGMLGYARSHKIADVVQDIIDNYEHNIEHANSDEYKVIGPKLRMRLHQVGFEQTKRLVSEGRYPNSEQFHASISTYLTSKSSGAAPIAVNYVLKDKITGKSKSMKQSHTSKAARAMFSGENVFDMTGIRPRFPSIIEYYNSVSNEDKKRIMEEGLNDQDVKAIGISSIGSRATTATRAIRGIFVIPIQLHMAFCAIAKPHVDDTSRPPESGDVQSIFINPYNYGSSILTQFQDGSVDAYSPFIQASSSRRYIISAADASAWDQHCKFDLMAAWIEGIRDAFADLTVSHDEYYMYLKGNGITLTQICDEIIEFLRFGLFSISYGDSIRVVKTNFMLSGLLVTFLLNSIINSEINYEMNEDLSGMSVNVMSMLIAGDDIGTILKMDIPNAANIERVRELICAKYTAAGHKINKNKSVMSNRSIEMAKIYAHLGFVFNDPYMQVNESEKTGKDESRISALRGFVHKQFDAFRRSASSSRHVTFTMRLCSMLAYHIKMFDKTDVTSAAMKYKYYPPYAAAILPSGVRGGLGCSWTGVSLNEVIWLNERMSSSVNPAIPVVDSLRFDSQEVFANAFLKKVVPATKHHLLPKVNRPSNFEITDVSVSSTNANDAPLSVTSGLEYKIRHLRPERIQLSSHAYSKLNDNGISVDDSLRYENAPISDMIQFSNTLKRSATANRDENVLNITKLFDLKTNEFKIKSENKNLYQYYKLYGIVDFSVNFHDQGVNNYVYDAVRRPITPDTFISAERRHGSRHGDAVRLNLMGINKALQRFVGKTGAHVTAEAIQAAMIKYDMLSDVNSEGLLIDLLTTISGDLNASTQAVHEMKAVDHTWSDMMVASTINGTAAEYLDLKYDNINKVLVVLTKVIPAPLAKLIKYSAFNYLLACEAYYGRTVRIMTLNQNGQTLKLISDTKKTSRKKKIVDKTSEELYQTYERLRIEFDVNYKILIDENRD
ncbi:RdRp [Aedes camptorhynchus reo-like virus]|uniref:RdRp n=1 Tax=Aedes camptorhynchus reo-like virus TaxID=2010269 RepID=UPI000B5BC81F|nr:RdRp [Aedes camptorhynchus reo-like virus]ASA47352.1 RdRp [Aedes camptorhynchus reo-like virus]